MSTLAIPSPRLAVLSAAGTAQNYVVTLAWNQSIVGVGESWITPSLSPNDATTWIRNWLTRRFNLLCNSDFPLGVRVKVYGSTRQSTLLLPNGGVPIPGATNILAFPPSGANNTLDGSIDNAPVRNVLQLQVQFGAGRKTSKYMSGVPRAILGTEPYAFDAKTNPGFFATLTNYTTWLQQNSAMLEAQDWETYKLSSVTGLVNQGAAPSLMGLVVPTVQGGAINAGDRVQVSGFRPLKGQKGPTINGTWTVDSVVANAGPPASTTLYLKNSQGVDITTQRVVPNTRGPGLDPTGSRVRKIVKKLYTINAAFPMRATVTHKRGKSSLSYRGRRQSNPSLDP